MATHAINDLAAHAFELVNKELVSTLDAARAELEDYVDGRGGPEALLRTAEHYTWLASVLGMFALVEPGPFFEAGLLAAGTVAAAYRAAYWMSC